MFKQKTAYKLRIRDWSSDVCASVLILDRSDRLVEACLGLALQFELDEALDTARADHHRHADIQVIDTVLARQVRRARQQALLVLEVALGHHDRAGRRRVEGDA